VTHLGARLSALADGQLGAAETERALAHVACCPRCAGELAAARAAHSTLAAAADVAPADDLTARLLALPSTCGPTVAGDPFAAPRPVHAVIGAAQYAVPARGLTGDVCRRRHSTLLVAGSAMSVGVVAAMLFLLGDQPTVLPSAHRGDALGVLGQAVVAAPASDAAEQEQVAWLHEQSWAFPSALPEGWSVVAVRDGVDGAPVEIDLQGPDGTAVVTEQAGRLDTEALAPAGTQELGGRTVHVLSTDPWHVTWQCGSSVVEIVADRAPDGIDALVAAFPGEGYDAGVPARITRGWDAVTTAFGQP